MSFRATIHAQNVSERGFSVEVDSKDRKILVSFDSSKVHDKHEDWLKNVKKKVGLSQLEPQPYWGFDDLEHKAGTKLLNTFYVQAEVKRDRDTKEEFYRYSKIMMLQKFSIEGFIGQLEKGNVLVDFDARTGHNHGTKFRMRRNCWPDVYEKVKVIK